MPYFDTEVGAARPMLQHRLLVPSRPPDNNVLSAFPSSSAPMTASQMFFGDGGKHHFPTPHSDTYAFKPGRRKLYPSKSGSAVQGGLRRIPIPVPKTKKVPEQRHLPDAQRRSGYDVPEHSIETALNRKILVRREGGELARDFISAELTLDRAFGVKKKCEGGIRQSRNTIPVANPGDKLYSAVEYSPGFYKEFSSGYSRVGGRTGTGGKVLDIPEPGQAKIQARARDSTKMFNPAGMTNTLGRGDTLNFRPRLSYEEKVRIAATQAAIAEVGELTEGVVTDRNEDGLSWEQRTGLYVWKTKDQKKKDEEASE